MSAASSIWSGSGHCSWISSQVSSSVANSGRPVSDDSATASRRPAQVASAGDHTQRKCARHDRRRAAPARPLRPRDDEDRRRGHDVLIYRP